VVEQCFADLTAGDRYFVEVQSFEADAGAMRLWRARWPGDGNAVGETFPYELGRFAVESGADTACVRDGASLSYQFGHHNWNEVWEARTEAARYVGTEVLNEQWQDTLTVYPLAGDTPTFGPAPMVATGCYTLPYNLHPCLRRDRIDEPPADWE
jgi:hypothetical protein